MTARPRRLSFVLLALLLLPSLASAESSAADVADLVARGDQELRASNGIAAMRAFRAALQEDPDSWQARDGLGRTFRAIGDLESAERELRRAVELAPGETVPARHLADLLGSIPSPERRRSGIEWLGRHATGAFEIQMFVAREGRRSGDLLVAREALARARSLQPENKEAMVEEILLRRDALDYEVAEALALAFIERYPSYHQTHIQLGMIYRMQGRLDQATASYRRALELTLDEPTALTRLGEIFLETGSLPEAREMLERAVMVRPQSHQAHYLLGRVYLQLGETEAAQQEMKKFRELKDALRARTRLAGGAAMVDE